MGILTYMSVQFQEESMSQYQSSTIPGRKNVKTASGMAGWLIKRGLAKDLSQANQILIVILILLLIGVYFSLSSNASNNSSEIVLPEGVDPETYLPYGVEIPK